MPDIIKLSRSTVEKYLSCQRCCVLDKKYQIKPPSLPFTLNIAVDNLCKNEFDYYRNCLLYTSPSPRDGCRSRMPSSA